MLNGVTSYFPTSDPASLSSSLTSSIIITCLIEYSIFFSSGLHDPFFVFSAAPVVLGHFFSAYSFPERHVSFTPLPFLYVCCHADPRPAVVFFLSAVVRSLCVVEVVATAHAGVSFPCEEPRLTGGFVPNVSFCARSSPWEMFSGRYWDYTFDEESPFIL